MVTGATPRDTHLSLGAGLGPWLPRWCWLPGLINASLGAGGRLIQEPLQGIRGEEGALILEIGRVLNILVNATPAAPSEDSEQTGSARGVWGQLGFHLNL